MPANESDAEAAVAAVNGILEALEFIVQRARESRNIQLFYAEMDRWKVRSTAILREKVSDEDATAFEQISVRPSWVSMESEDDSIERNVAFLQAVAIEITDVPDRFRRIIRSEAPPRLESRPIVQTNESPKRVAEAESIAVPQRSDPASGLNAWLDREAGRRGRVWTVIVTVLGLLLATIGIIAA